MNLKTARIISFILSTVALVIALVYFTSSNKAAMKSWIYVGLGLILLSLIIRNIIRFKPDLFKEKKKDGE